MMLAVHLALAPPHGLSDLLLLLIPLPPPDDDSQTTLSFLAGGPLTITVRR